MKYLQCYFKQKIRKAVGICKTKLKKNKCNGGPLICKVAMKKFICCMKRRRRSCGRKPLRKATAADEETEDEDEAPAARLKFRRCMRALKLMHCKVSC